MRVREQKIYIPFKFFPKNVLGGKISFWKKKREGGECDFLQRNISIFCNSTLHMVLLKPYRPSCLASRAGSCTPWSWSPSSYSSANILPINARLRLHKIFMLPTVPPFSTEMQYKCKSIPVKNRIEKCVVSKVITDLQYCFQWTITDYIY